MCHINKTEINFCYIVSFTNGINSLMKRTGTDSAGLPLFKHMYEGSAVGKALPVTPFEVKTVLAGDSVHEFLNLQRAVRSNPNCNDWELNVVGRNLVDITSSSNPDFSVLVMLTRDKAVIFQHLDETGMVLNFEGLLKFIKTFI